MLLAIWLLSQTAHDYLTAWENDPAIICDLANTSPSVDERPVYAKRCELLRMYGPEMFRSKARRPVGINVSNLLRHVDYPVDALAARAQGTVRVHLDIDDRGYIVRCVVVRSSRHPSLDGTTCARLVGRQGYRAAFDASGKPTFGTDTINVTWRLPD